MISRSARERANSTRERAELLIKPPPAPGIARFFPAATIALDRAAWQEAVERTRDVAATSS